MDGDPAPLTWEAGKAARSLHMAMGRAKDFLGSCKIDALFAVSSGEKGRHVDALDGYIDSKMHSKSVMTAADREVTLWTASWTQQLRTIVEAVTSSVPPGWAVHKSDLLAVENAEVVKALLANAHFQRLSTNVGQLGQHFEMLCLLKREGCASMIPAELWSSCKTALQEGTETVSVTYALYQLRTAIPKLAGPVKRKAVETLRAEMRKRGVDLGASLDAECARMAQ